MLQRPVASVVAVLVRSWKVAVMASPGVALPQTWMGMSRWRTMWLEKSFGRKTSACVVRVAARRQRVRRSFMKGLRLLLYLGVVLLKSLILSTVKLRIMTNTGILRSRRRIRFRKNICRRSGFFLAGKVAFLQGYLRKTVSQTWCFGGEFVVICVVNVVA